MKATYLKLVLPFILSFSSIAFAQNSDVQLVVKWPDKSYENKIEVYNTTNDLLVTICDDNQCYTGTYDGDTDEYGAKYNLGCVTNGNNYYVKLYQINDNSWDSGNVTVIVAGTEVINDDGSNASASGYEIYFDVSGGDATCNTLIDTDQDGIIDNLDYDDDGDGIVDYIESLGEDAFTCTIPALDFENPVYEASISTGLDKEVGAVYRFSNAIQGYDILLEILELDNTTIHNIDNDTVDNPSYLQTELQFSGTGTPGAEFGFTIVNTGTAIPSSEIFRINGTTWDCDGYIGLQESLVFHNPSAYGTENPTSLVTEDLGGGDIQISASGLQEGPGFSNLKVLKSYYQFIGNSFALRMQNIKTSSGTSSVRQYGLSFSQCEFLDFNANALTIVTGKDNDGDAKYNHLDLDSDNDGIPDNVEGQRTLGYLAPSNVIENRIGIDLIYGETGIDVVDTDNDKIPDYIDSDSDSDGIPDIEENGMLNTITTFTDADNDGLDNVFEGSNTFDPLDVNDELDNPSASVLPDTDGDLVLGGDLDYRDTIDTYIESATIDFDGVDDYIDSDLDVSNYSQATFMAWVKLDNSFSNTGVVLDQDNFSVEVIPSGGLIVRLNQGSINASASLTLNEWTHVAVVYDASLTSNNLKLYINGKQEGASSDNSLDNDIDVSNEKFTIGKSSTSNSKYFNGDIDEVRVFNVSLTKDQLNQIIYQEIENNSGTIGGKVISKLVSDNTTNATVSWSSLVAYYPMTNILSSRTTDYSDNDYAATLHNITTLQDQTAPMPYQTKSDGDWTTENSWLYGDVWNMDELSNSGYAIVKVSHDLAVNLGIKTLGLLVDSGKTITVNGDNEVNNSWYLGLDGTIDLQGDSQLVQGIQSDLVTSVNGKILRRQEGASSVYWYNYWGSPVGLQAATSYSDNNTSTNNTNNTAFTHNMLKDGTGAALQYTNAYDEVGKVSTKWLYGFVNGVTYYDWNLLTPSEAIPSGTGYIQKGTGLGSEQQYIFEGKPNNGTILVSATDTGGPGSVVNSTATSTLLGNPYPSAIDARQFIADNATGSNPVIDGTILLWQQWAGNSHTTVEYQGGYAYVNGLTTVKAAQYPYAGTTGSEPGGTKRPSFYIPVSQGFFVEVVGDGDIEFNNNQRVFVKESDADEFNPNVGSTFFKNSNTSTEQSTSTSETNYQLLRLELSMSDSSSRTMVLGFDSSFTDEGREYGFDGGFINTPLSNDLGSLLNGDQYVIQALAPITDDKVVDLTFTATGTETYTIKSIEIANIPDTQDIYLRDNLLGVYHDLRSEQGYNFTSEAGTFNDRFDVVFNNGAQLSTEEFEALNAAAIFYNNNQETLYVKGLKEDVKQLNVYNALGQTILNKRGINKSILENGLPISNLSTGLYIVSLKTESNQTVDKKIIIE